MGFNCGIVGLPNVGKSTLFNAVTNTTAAAAANYPFCTIEPNIGRVPVPDPRLDTLARLGKSAKIGADPARDQGHCRAGARRVQGRGAGQQVPGRHPRGRRHPRGAALLRGRRRHPCRGQRRSRCATPSWSRPSCCWPTSRAWSGRRTGWSSGRAARTRRPRRGWSCSSGSCRAMEAGRQARTLELSDEERQLLRRLQPADRQADPLRLQRRRGLGRRGQRADRARGGAGARAGCAPRGDLRRDRGRAVRAGRGREGRVSGQHGPGGAGPEPGDPRGPRAAGPAHLLHRRPQGGARLDRASGCHRARRRQA